MRRLFRGGVYFELTFLKITDDSYCKSFVNIMSFKGSNVSCRDRIVNVWMV